MNGDLLLDIRQLAVDYVSKRGLIGQNDHRVRVLENLTLPIYRGETVGIVGESGCGKTTLANSLMRFVPAAAGQIVFEGRNILELDRGQMRKLRREIQMLFQNPYSSVNPRMSVHRIVAEPLLTHSPLRGKALETQVTELLGSVGLDGQYLKRHPHEMSGGQLQRVALARALALRPKLVILDEPTSALDVSVQAQIVNLLELLQTEYELTYIFISHDLGVVEHLSDRIAVLYLGEIVEMASRDSISGTPLHPYTQALFSSTPVPDPDSNRKRIILEGTVPSPANPPAGCRFHTRCPHAGEVCRSKRPALREIDAGHWASCHLLDA